MGPDKGHSVKGTLALLCPSFKKRRLSVTELSGNICVSPRHTNLLRNTVVEVPLWQRAQTTPGEASCSKLAWEAADPPAQLCFLWGHGEASLGRGPLHVIIGDKVALSDELDP